MKKLIVAVLAIMLIPALAMAEKRLTITTYGADYAITYGVSTSIDEDTGTVTFTPTVSIRDLALGKTIKAWTNPLPADPATMSLTDVTDGVSTWKGTVGTDLKAAILAAMQAGFKVLGVVETADKLAQISMSSIKLFKSTDGVGIDSPGVPTAITWP